jgi:hypothetical protein
MAKFCKSCADRNGLPVYDIEADPGGFVYTICEGCGYGWFNDQGQRVPESEICPKCLAPKQACMCEKKGRAP